LIEVSEKGGFSLLKAPFFAFSETSDFFLDKRNFLAIFTLLSIKKKDH